MRRSSCFPHPRDGRAIEVESPLPADFKALIAALKRDRERRQGLMAEPEFLVPGWPVPARVRAAMTTRAGGVSAGPRASLNLATHVGDEPAPVTENRRRLRDALGLPAEPAWLEQVHGTGVAVLPAAARGIADAAVTFTRGTGLCRARRRLPAGLPRKPHGRSRRHRARGLARARRGRRRGDPCRARVRAAAILVAWLGPSIGPRAFEVGDDVRDAFLARDGGAAAEFQPARRPLARRPARRLRGAASLPRASPR